MSRPCVFLDKDGTLVENVPYNVDPALIHLTTGAREGLARLHEAGYALVVISNQAGVARGRFTERALPGVESRLRELLAEDRIPLTGFYYCPHHPDGSVGGYAVNCSCRKPAPGMLLRAARAHDLDLDRSWLVGDILDDIEAGRAAGVRTIMLANGNETEWVVNARRWPDHFASNLDDAAHIVLGNGRRHFREERTLQPARSASDELPVRISSLALGAG